MRDARIARSRSPDIAPGDRSSLRGAPSFAVQVFDDGRYGLRLVGGAGALGVLATNESSRRTTQVPPTGEPPSWSVPAAVCGLHFEVVHLITSAQDAGFAQCLEIELGVVTLLGRRERSW
jgi:hypothetical protein